MPKIGPLLPKGPAGATGPAGPTGPTGPAPDTSVYETLAHKDQASGYLGLDGNSRVAIGASSPTTDTVTAKLLIKPSADADNAIVVKRPNATWGTASYGKGQTFVLLKDAVSPSDIGYSGVTPDDFVIARMDSYGAVGLGANIHLATGLRAPAGYAPAYAFKINPYVDTPFLVMQGTGITQTQKFISASTPGGQEVFALSPSGNATFGKNSSGKGLVVGDTGYGSSGYFGVAHSDYATSPTKFALLQGPNGETYLNAVTGQTILFQIENSTKCQMSATQITLGGILKHTGTQVAFFNVAAASRTAAYTQTYATATRTHANDTASDMATTAATNVTPFGFATQAQADAIATKFNALRVDVDNIKQVLNSVIDDHQLYGLFQ